MRQTALCAFFAMTLAACGGAGAERYKAPGTATPPPKPGAQTTVVGAPPGSDAAGSSTSTVDKSLDLGAPTLVKALDLPPSKGWLAAVTPDAQLIAVAGTGSGDRMVHLFKADGTTAAAFTFDPEAEQMGAGLAGLAFADGGKTVVTVRSGGSTDGTKRIRFWSQAGAPLAALPLGESEHYPTSFSGDGAFMAVATGQTLAIFDVLNRNKIKETTVGTVPILSVIVSKDGSTIATSDAQAGIKTFDRTLKQLAPITATGSLIGLSSDGKGALLYLDLKGGKGSAAAYLTGDGSQVGSVGIDDQLLPPAFPYDDTSFILNSMNGIFRASPKTGRAPGLLVPTHAARLLYFNRGSGLLIAQSSASGATSAAEDIGVAFYIVH